ncbi:peptidoglycan-binding protein [Streptomyces sp. NPDC059781]|uniref:peptidoglycan-binding domain-containing protein n=1 Tax=unclassified Streptomyces TaxID=2593676 RepID=UPI0036539BB9
MWQTILRADGYLGTNHSVAVDCSFGANALAATKQWQKDHGLVADWVAGPKTFTKAGQYLRADGTNIYGEDIINYDYPGPRPVSGPPAPCDAGRCHAYDASYDP